MKALAHIGLVLIFFSCTADEHGPSYIKIIIGGEPKKTTVYNKGLGAAYYSYFDPQHDSLTYLYPKAVDHEGSKFEPHAFKGELNNANFRDTFLQLFQSLNWRPVGDIEKISETVMYCGMVYYVEFDVDNSIKHYIVIEGVSDTLDRFLEFFIRLQKSDWEKKPLDPKRINLDQEVVNSFKRIGEYEKREVPYIFPECKDEIDFNKLTGRWRVVSAESRYTKKNGFIVRTLNKDGTFTMDRFDSGKLKEITRGTYIVNVKQKKIIYTNTAGGKMVQTVKQITDSCFTGIENIFQSNRVDEVKLNRF